MEVVVDLRNGELVAQDHVETTDDASALVLKADRSAIHADGVDLSMITVSAIDNDGRAVPTADEEVTFTITGQGKIIGVGNGDPSSHESDKANHRRLFNGLAQVIVQSGRSAGKIELTASAPQMNPATIEIDAQPSPPLPQVP
ncbi:MAG TPA: hypothetical protein VLI90_02925 [Tepidisphaeraceae bacterium]|nr:hypothetical protein [Tepidisphaeraceae bacterium]